MITNHVVYQHMNKIEYILRIHSSQALHPLPFSSDMRVKSVWWSNIICGFRRYTRLLLRWCKLFRSRFVIFKWWAKRWRFFKRNYILWSWWFITCTNLNDVSVFCHWLTLPCRSKVHKSIQLFQLTTWIHYQKFLTNTISSIWNVQSFKRKS